MNSKSSIDSKIAADAINQGSASVGNLSSNVTNMSPLLKDSKRVIKRMIVMDTSKLKGLGIESTIKNAMSKLGKGKNVRTDKPTFNPVNVPPMQASPKVLETVIKSEFEPNNVSVKPAATVTKHIYRPAVPFSATSNSTTGQIPVQSKSMTARPASTHHVIHSPRQSINATTNNVSFQSVSAVNPPVSVVKSVATSTSVPATSTNSMKPTITTSTATVPIVKAHRNGPIPSNCKAKIVPAQSNNPVIKVEKTVQPPIASDGKKIKVLSNVSLIDGKSKLLEIDKLTSKNLKFTNVIKGTDKNPPKATVHSNFDSMDKELPSHPSAVHVKVETDPVTKFTHVIKGSDERQSRTPVSTPNFTRAPVFSQPPVPKPMQTEFKLTSSVHLKPQHGAPKLIFHTSERLVKPSSTAAIPTKATKVEKEKFDSKNLKVPSSIDGTNRTTPPIILNYSNVVVGNTPKSDFKNQPVRSSYPTSRPIKTEFHSDPPKNVIITNASKPAVQIVTTTRKSATPLFSSSTPIKTEPIEHNDFDQPNYKASTEFPSYNVARPTVCKVAKATTFTRPTSAATEVATKQLVTTDENLEIYKPSAQKYLSKSNVSTEQTSIDDAATKRFHDAVWSTNNPRTYARHNIKRLLSDKIIKKSRSPEEHVHNEQTSEKFVAARTEPDDSKNVAPDEVSTVACDSKSENVKTQTEPTTTESIPWTSELTSVDDPDQSPVKLPIQAMDISTDSEKVELVSLETKLVPLQSSLKTALPVLVDETDRSASTDEPMDVDTNLEKVETVSLETESICNPSTPSTSPIDDSAQPPVPPIDANTTSKNNFCGFSMEEVNASHSLLSQIRAVLSRKQQNKTTPVTIPADSTVGNEKEIKTVAYDSWILNHETGVLEEKIDRAAKVTSIPSSRSHSINESTAKKLLSSIQFLKDSELECTTSGFSPSKTPVIEDADDEISDIDLFHRSKTTKCTGSTMNRRAIFKSIELNRKSALPATTDDDESEPLSLRVRPPRPKLRRSRHKQTVEQLKVQQNAHISLLKRFIRADSNDDNLKDEVLMSFVDSVDQRIEVLENQVKCCFKKGHCNELNVEAISPAEQSVFTFVDLMKDVNEPVKPSESVTESNESVKSSESSHAQLGSVVTCEPSVPEPILPSNAEISDNKHRQGHLTIHEVTIQKDTFLVTEYENQCDTINHVPLNVKLERDSSTKQSISDRVRKTTKPTVRKKRKRKSLVEMLAKHVDQETLKSVIIAHAKQKCDLSSSLDSESDDSDRGDVVSKIFRTVCTIDLCDDDDETLHEDVLQYLNETEETEMEIEQDSMSVAPSCAADSDTNHELPESIDLPESSGERPTTEKIESRSLETLVNPRDTSSTTVIDAPSKSSIENRHVCEKRDPPSEKVTDIPTKERDETPIANLCNEMPSLSTLATSNVSLSTVESSDVPLSTVTTSNVSLMDFESNIPNSIDDDNHIEAMDESVDVEANAPPSPDKSLQEDEILTPEKSPVEEVPTLDISKSDDMCDNTGKVTVADKNVLRVCPAADQSKIEQNVPAAVTDNTDTATTVAVPMDAISNATKEQPLDVEVSTAAPTDPKSDISVMISPKRAIIKLRPIEEISCRPRPKRVDNDFVKEPSAGSKLSFEETLSKVDAAIGKESRSRRRKHKSSKSTNDDAAEMKRSDNSNESHQKSSRIVVVTPEKPTKVMKQPSKDKIQLSSVSVNDDIAAGPIKIKIKLRKDTQEPNDSTTIPNNDAMNGVPKPSRSRKRKSAVLEDSASVAITTPQPMTETTRKRPIFDYFDSPEILTTKRARKSKSYVDLDDQIENVPTKTPPPPPSNPRTSKRRSNTSKSSAQSDLPKSDSTILENVEEEKDQKDVPTTEPVPVVVPQNIEEPNAQPIEPVALTVPKSGRGIRPPVLAPINVADQYVCGNCKEEVTAKDWTKHIRSHYGLAWRVDVDPPIDMDNIHTMSSKVLNFTKKANIKILKCPKCDVEKKSALGYLSHLEVCGLTPEEVKSKLVKCEHCPSMIRSCSMKIHLTFCSGLKRLMQKEKESTKDAENAEECYNDIGRAVRRSAQKAMSSFKDLGKAPEAKLEDYVERVEKISNKQLRKWRQLLKEASRIECVRNGCEFTTDDLVSMANHFSSCVLVDGETFYCTRCEHGPDTRVAIEEHIKATHSLGIIESIDDKVFSDSDDDAELGEESSESEGESGDDEISDRDGGDSDFDDDEDDDGWNTKGYKKKRLRDWPHNEVMLNSCLDRKVLSDYASHLRSYSGGSYFYPTLEWTQDFRDTHFSNDGLLPMATPNTFSVLCSTLTHLYLPRVQQSNKFLVKYVRKYRKLYGSTEINKSDSWKSLKRFEATTESDCLVLFTGGPVLSMAWIPVPDDHLSQMLAVCCRRDADDDILMNNTKAVKCLIQIWNFHKLSNGQLRQAQTPQLLYSVAYDHGPVIQMEFCPSGGFTDDRLGLLAVSSYDGHVDILALPKNFTCDNSKIENLVFTIEPALRLCCERDQPFGVLMTKLVWSQSKGHTKLAGGFANGLVAIWNLKNLETPYNCSTINGIPTLLPTDLFFAGNKTIRLLEFHHDETDEARWLIAGSHDRKVKFFDTHNVYVEISTTTAHSRIVAGCWPMHWTSFLLGIDNAYSLKISGIIVKQPLDIGCRTSTFYSCIGSTCDISFNNWLNSYVFVTSYGDIHVGYVRQMISGFGETRRQRSILGYTDSVDIRRSDSTEGDGMVIDETPTSDEQEPSTSSADASEPAATEVSYPSADGIVFCDFPHPLPAVTSPSYEKIGAPPMSTYNMVKVNRVVFNPNVSAYKLYALGYECGFVRINQLLPK